MTATTTVQKRVAFDEASRVRLAWITKALTEHFQVSRKEAQQHAIQRRALECLAVHLESLIARDDELAELARNVERQRVRAARKGEDLGVTSADVVALPLRPLS